MKYSSREILISKELKVTPSRIMILDLFLNDCKPINAEYVFEKIKTNKINLATVYRTLVSFETKSILRRIDLHKDSVHYELSNHHHHHIVCNNCGIFESFENCSIKDLSNDVLNNSVRFRTIQNHSLELFGTCNSCAKISK